MKALTTMITFLFLFGFFATVAFAQDVTANDSLEQSPENTITVDPFAVVYGGWIGLEYERAISPYASLFGDLSANFGTGIGNDLSEGDSMIGFGLEAGARFFPFGEAPEGFFLSPEVGTVYVDLETDDGQGWGLGFTASAMAGYTFLIGDVVDLSLGLGVAYLGGVAEGSDNNGVSEDVDFDYILPTGRISLGFAF